MEQQYHRCGYPLLVRRVYNPPAYALAYYEAVAPPTVELSVCPQCGEALTEEALRDAPPSAEALALWAATWPALRAQLERGIQARSRRDERFYAYHAERELREFERALQHVARLAAAIGTAAPEEPEPAPLAQQRVLA